ncbi:hypothetical protein LSCM4_07993 [Leishmania orientalis]|uniref:Centromere protein J C-terminal domain-containing protein n=1 Tax=Leishmania orientalis TaxID=2249476 RepID=A0A836H016_9TRYP|nr:hypothetical protein LSCM4_07993 [Leishmania orientalis]
MSRVSVFAGQKPKPKESFKFLRRDEGRLSYSVATAESPLKAAANGNDGAHINRERRDSKALREAIAYDMRNAKSHDPLGEVVVAVPRKAPPPTRAVSAPPANPSTSSETEKPTAMTPSQRRPPVRAVSAKKPEWVHPDVSPSPQPQARQRSEPEQPADRYSDTSFSDFHRGGAAPPLSGGARASSRGSDANGADLGRYGGLTPRSAAVGAPRYAASEYEEWSAAPSSGPDRNYFRRPHCARDPVLAPDVPAPAGGRNREEDELIASLEQEIKAAQKERDHYVHARQQLDQEKQRFEAYRYSAQQQMEDERAGAGDRRSREQRDALRDLRAAEERCRSVSALLVAERETNRRLTQENDSLRTQLEDLTSTMREAQSIHKAEVVRMRRDIDSLTRRNGELLAMAKEQQLHSLEGASSSPAMRQSSTSHQPAVCDPSAGHISSPSHEDGDDGGYNAAAARQRRGSRASPPAVMDFTPRVSAADAAARERRNRQMQDRMQAEEEAMEERRRQREKWMAERKKEGREKEARQRAAASTAAASTARRQREEEDQRRAAAGAAKPAEERKVSGHPVHTPRMQPGEASVKRRLSASVPPQPVQPKRYRVPTREELIGDLEEFPTETLPNDGIVSETALGDNPNKKEVLYRSGKREIHYANGTVKVLLPSGHTTLHFTNADVKCTFPSGKSTYWYDAAQTMHTQMPDGVQVFEFRSTGQTEKHLPDGRKEILYPDGIFKVVQPDGGDATFYPNGEPLEE